MNRLATLGKVALWLAPVLLLCAMASAAQARGFDELVYMTEEYFPYNYTERGVLKGLSVDLLLLTWDELGVEVQPIQAMPWARAYDRIQHENSTVLFSMARTPERERMFRWAGPILVARFVLVARKDSHITINAMEDVNGYRVGTLRDDVSDLLLRGAAKEARIEAVADMTQNVQKLASGRLDLVAYEERAWGKVIHKLGLNPDDYVIVSVLKESPVYYAFHVDVPTDMVQAFQDALDRVKARPAYRQLLDSYLQ